MHGAPHPKGKTRIVYVRCTCGCKKVGGSSASKVHNECPGRGFLNAKTCCNGHLEQHLYAILSLLLSQENKMRFHWKTKAATVTQAGRSNREKKKKKGKARAAKFSSYIYSLV